MNKIIALFSLLILILTACGETKVKPEVKPQKVTQTQPVTPEQKLDMQFDYVINIANFFQLKSYSGDRVYYNSRDFQTPDKIKGDVEYLSDEGINYLILLRSEILARKDARFDTAVIQRIFNSTFWYNQFASKKGMYNEARLNIYEKENIRRINEILQAGKDIKSWDE